MAFNSLQFLGFLGVVLAAYNLIPRRLRAVLLLFASYVFYANWSLPHLALLFWVTGIAYLGAIRLAATPSGTLVALNVAAAVAPLVITKYGVLVMGAVGWFRGSESLNVASAIVPVGVSFYTFQAISYIVDVYKRTLPAEHSLVHVALYLAWFPQILAGPIERASRLLPQLAVFANSRGRDAYIGAKYLLWGFFCKLVVADNVALLVDRALRWPAVESGGSLAATFVLYSFQIYFDFLGYTAIAIGVARFFGVQLHHNFDRPYCATSLRDFWHRWHITLSTWFRDYVYVPLGGSTTRGPVRVGQILTVFLLSGLWHGAAPNFVAWGGVHGAAYLIEEQARKRTGGGLPASHWNSTLIGRLAKITITFTVVTVAWVFFRLSNFADIQHVLAKIFFIDRTVPYSTLNAILTEGNSLLLIAVLATAVWLDSSGQIRRTLETVPRTRRDIGRELAQVNWLGLTLILLGDRGTRDFIYFRF